MKQLESKPRVLHVRKLGEAIVISPEGPCDQDCITAMDGLVEQIEDAPQQNIILDASHLKYIDTTGFRWIIKHCRKLQDFGGSLIVAGLKGPAERAFKLLQLDRFIPASTSVEGALARLRHKSGENAA